MRRTPNEDRALAWYMKQNNLKPKLSAYPIYYFDNEAGEEESVNVVSLVPQFKAWRKEQKNANRPKADRWKTEEERRVK